MKWIPVDKKLPNPGERVLVCNATSIWTTDWKDGLVRASHLVHPVTHYVPAVEIERPYPATPKESHTSELHLKRVERNGRDEGGKFR